jgi:DnaJ-class molecular chaperone
MKVPKHAQSGQLARLKGRGVKRKDQQGDLLVRFMIRLPDKETAEVDKAVEALSHATSENLRDGITF